MAGGFRKLGVSPTIQLYAEMSPTPQHLSGDGARKAYPAAPETGSAGKIEVTFDPPIEPEKRKGCAPLMLMVLMAPVWMWLG